MRCPDCHREFADTDDICPSCGTEITPRIRAAYETVEVEARRLADMKLLGIDMNSIQPPGWDNPRFRAFGPALKYPFTGVGNLALILGLLIGVFGMLSFIYIFFFPSAVIGGYLILFYFGIVNKSSSDRKAPPEWPDFSGAWDLFTAVFMAGVLYLVSFGPLRFIVATHSNLTGGGFLAYGIVAAAWGAIYFPMGFLVIAQTRNLMSLFPWVVVAAIARAPFRYFLLCAAVFVVFALPDLLIIKYLSGKEHLLQRVLISPPRGVLNCYLAMVLARIVGLNFEEFIRQ